jgi:RHS repeat-associated protein
VRGELAVRILSKWTGQAWAQEQKSERSYFDNGRLKQLTNFDGANALLEQHTLGYIRTGVYEQGNKLSDTFKLLGPDPSAPCRSTTCTAGWRYDARERLSFEDTGTGTTNTLTLDTIGNVTAESAGSISRSYSGQKLISQTSNGSTQKYLYDAFGNLDCTTSASWAQAACPAGGNTALLEDYGYDYKNRLTGYAKYASGTQTDSAAYVNDPLDRPISQTETHSGQTTSSAYSYIGDTNALSAETLTGASNTTRKYSYDAHGRRLTLSDGANRYSYLYDHHGSVSLLIDQGNTVKASYGYTGYGSANSSLTKLAPGFNANANAYRYTGKRYDTGSGTYDMGARRYSAATGRFLQQDLYYGALGNLGLSNNPYSASRYQFTGANPINFVEYDGHYFVADGDFGDPSAPAPPLVFVPVPPPIAPPPSCRTCSGRHDTGDGESVASVTPSTAAAVPWYSPDAADDARDDDVIGTCSGYRCLANVTHDCDWKGCDYFFRYPTRPHEGKILVRIAIVIGVGAATARGGPTAGAAFKMTVRVGRRAVVRGYIATKDVAAEARAQLPLALARAGNDTLQFIRSCAEGILNVTAAPTMAAATRAAVQCAQAAVALRSPRSGR